MKPNAYNQIYHLSNENKTWFKALETINDISKIKHLINFTKKVRPQWKIPLIKLLFLFDLSEPY
jgi:hypothetical protein